MMIPPKAMNKSNMTASDDSIGPHDVLLGRGGRTNTHLGNRRYRAIVAKYQPEYLAAKKKDKIVIARRIVSIIHANGGRFLKQGNGVSIWMPIPNPKAINKTSQALREGLDVRHKTVRPNKIFRHDLKTFEEDSCLVAGKVVPPTPTTTKTITFDSSPTVVSVATNTEHDSHSIPDLRDEIHRHSGYLKFYPVPLSEAIIDDTCEV